MQIPRLMIAAAQSGAGKTMLTCGLLQLLMNRGKKTTAFKCGPDYIDPMFHSRVIGSRSRNLDSFFCGEELLVSRFLENAEGSDLALLEGVMGYYDGIDGTTTMASGYEVSRITKTPVILLINAAGMSLSAAAVIRGFLDFRPDHQIRGVILNRVSPMLYPRLKQSIEAELNIPVFGYLPQIKEFHLESRHLGLLMPEEIQGLQEMIRNLAEILEGTLDVNGLLSLAEQAAPLREQGESLPGTAEEQIQKQICEQLQEQIPFRIGVAKDEAFCFFYEDNLALLRKMGAELIFFSPIHEEKLPQDLDGLLLYGGYPELHAKALSENRSMRDSIAEAVKEGMPCMAECGGFMYLHEELLAEDGETWPMAGIIPGSVKNTGKLGRFGYISIPQASAFGVSVGELRAHEFHYYDSTNPGEDWTAVKPVSGRSWSCVHRQKTLLAGFPHLYYYSNPQIAAAFLQACVQSRSEAKEQKL